MMQLIRKLRVFRIYSAELVAGRSADAAEMTFCAGEILAPRH